MPGRKLKPRMDPERADDIREKPKNVRISEHASSRSREGLSAPEFIVILLFSPLAGLIGFLVWHGKKTTKGKTVPHHSGLHVPVLHDNLSILTRTPETPAHSST